MRSFISVWLTYILVVWEKKLPFSIKWDLVVGFLYTFNKPIMYNKYYNKRVWLFDYSLCCHIGHSRDCFAFYSSLDNFLSAISLSPVKSKSSSKMYRLLKKRKLDLRNATLYVETCFEKCHAEINWISEIFFSLIFSIYQFHYFFGNFSVSNSDTFFNDEPLIS